MINQLHNNNKSIFSVAGRGIPCPPSQGPPERPPAPPPAHPDATPGGHDGLGGASESGPRPDGPLDRRRLHPGANHDHGGKQIFHFITSLFHHFIISFRHFHNFLVIYELITPRFLICIKRKKHNIVEKKTMV